MFRESTFERTRKPKIPRNAITCVENIHQRKKKYIIVNLFWNVAHLQILYYVDWRWWSVYERSGVTSSVCGKKEKSFMLADCEGRKVWSSERLATPLKWREQIFLFTCFYFFHKSWIVMPSRPTTAFVIWDLFTILFCTISGFSLKHYFIAHLIDDNL
jgi:hypothetical protein